MRGYPRSLSMSACHLPSSRSMRPPTVAVPPAALTRMSNRPSSLATDWTTLLQSSSVNKSKHSGE
jgi:hypothetical protein